MNLKLHLRFPHKFIAEVHTDAVPRIGEALILDDVKYVVEAVNHVFHGGTLAGRDLFVRRCPHLEKK